MTSEEYRKTWNLIDRNMESLKIIFQEMLDGIQAAEEVAEEAKRRVEDIEVGNTSLPKEAPAAV